MQIEYDLTTSHLSNVNEYRKSVIDKYLEDKIDEISIDIDKIAYKEIKIIAIGNIKFKNKIVR